MGYKKIIKNFKRVFYILRVNEGYVKGITYPT